MAANGSSSPALDPHRRSRPWWRALAVALLGGGLGLGSAQAAEPQIVAVVLNAVLVADAAIVYPADGGGWWVNATALTRWRLRADDHPEQVLEGQVHQRVCGPGASLRCRHDEAGALLEIDADAASVNPLRVSAAPAAAATVPLTPPLHGGFVNYDLLMGRGAASVAAAQVDARLLPGAGEFYLQAGLAWARGQRRLLGRAMGWQLDSPERGWTLTLGGFASGSATPVAGLPLSGLRWASQRSLQPERAWLQRPLATGEVARTSRAELFVDGLYRRTADVPYGRFEFEVDALRPGAGQVQLTTTDARGQQTVQVQDYYLAPQLLPVGATEHALELGVLGRDLGRSSRHGPVVLSGHVRRGVDARTTWAAQGLLAGRTRWLGVTVDRGLGLAGVLRAGLSVADAGHGPRARALLAHEYQSERWTSVLQAEAGAVVSSPAPGAATPVRQAVTPLHSDRRQLSAALLAALSPRHQLTASVSARVDAQGRAQGQASLGLAWQAASRLQVLAGLQQRSDGRQTRLRQATLTLVLPLGGGQLATVSARTGSQGTAAQWTLQSVVDPTRAQVSESMTDWRLQGELGRQPWLGGSAWGDGRHGQWLLEAASGPGPAQVRGRYSGAVGWLAGAAFAGRRLDEAFVVVDTDGHAGVPVFLENRPAGTTDAGGRLLVAGARAWQANRISVDSAALPIEATLTRDQIDVRPRGRAGALVRFEIGDGGELVRVTLPDGRPLPAGARVQISSQADGAVIGSRSEVFVQRAGRPATVDVTWPGGRCRFDYVPVGLAGSTDAAQGFTCR